MGWAYSRPTFARLELDGVEEVDEVSGGGGGVAGAAGDEAARCEVSEGVLDVGESKACCCCDLAVAGVARVVRAVLGLSGEVQGGADLG